MTVYVDDMRARYGRLTMCHMIADSTNELLEMAHKIGVNTRWLQHADTHKEHFDISLSKRALAIRAGAIEVTQRQCAMMCANRRKTGFLGEPARAETVFHRLHKLPVTSHA